MIVVRGASLALVLAGLTAGLATAQPAPSSVPAAVRHAEARAAVQQVLAHPEFGGPTLQPGLGERLERWVASLLRAIGQAAAYLPGWLAWILVAWLVLTLLAVLAHLVYVLVGLVGAPGAKSGRSSPNAGRGALVGIHNLEYEEAYARAGELAAAGSWSEAARYAYVAAILWLDRAGLVSFRQMKTNRDLLRELTGHQRCHMEFDRLTGWFEAVAYGGRAADELLYKKMTGALEALRESDASAIH